MSVAARLVGEQLGVNRAFYAEIAGDDWIVGEGFVDGVEPLTAGRYAATEYGRWTMDTLRQGAVAAIEDTGGDPRLTPSERAALRGIDVGAVLGIPLVRDGRIVAVLSTHSRRPRQWTESDIGLVREAAARTWPWVERARVQVALQESEAKYRSLLESVDEGFCIIEIVEDDGGTPVDYRFLEVNGAFQHQTGLADVTGKPGSEVDPGSEHRWIDTYGSVARTGEATRFESHHDNTGRWYDVYATRVNDADSRQVAIVFRDITELKEREERQPVPGHPALSLTAQPD
jgi:PAS domain S-box-containing protein